MILIIAKNSISHKHDKGLHLYSHGILKNKKNNLKIIMFKNIPSYLT